MTPKINIFRGVLSMHIPWPYILSLVALFAILFIAFYNRIENFYVFFPQTEFDITPEALHMKYRNVSFYTEDGERLHGWFFPGRKEAPVILYCHGNACNISHLLGYAGLLLKKNLQVFLFDYRGYGKSTGSPSEKGIYMDVQAAYDYLIDQEKIPPGRIVMAGHSIGAAAAIDLMTRNYARSIIIESAFTSTKDLSREIFPISVISFLLPANYNNLWKIAKINAPKLIIHGQDDEIVPFEMGKKLFEASKDPKYFYPIAGAGHNNTFIEWGDGYFKTLEDFIYNSRLDNQAPALPQASGGSLRPSRTLSVE